MEWRPEVVCSQSPGLRYSTKENREASEASVSMQPRQRLLQLALAFFPRVLTMSTRSHTLAHPYTSWCSQT